MNKKTLLYSLCGLLSSASLALADWTVVNTFDDASALDSVTDTINVEGSGAHSYIVDGQLAVDPGDLFENTSNIYAMQDLGVDLKAASIASGLPVTVYTEITQPTVDDGAGGTRKAIVDHVWGLSNIDEDTVLTDRYNSFNAMLRVHVGDTFDVRNGDSTIAIDTLQADIKYKIWTVLDYNLGYYQVYVQGGQWTEQTLLDSGDGTGIWLFRVNPSPEQTVDKLLIAVSRGNSVDGEKARDSLLWDNIAVDTEGQNLSVPPIAGPAMGPGIFGNYPLIDGHAVATGSFMGAVSVGNYPWVFLYNIGNWGYVADPDSTGDPDSGSWIYVPKN